MAISSRICVHCHNLFSFRDCCKSATAGATRAKRYANCWLCLGVVFYSICYRATPLD